MGEIDQEEGVSVSPDTTEENIKIERLFADETPLIPPLCIVLASTSPRRKELLQSLFNFPVRVFCDPDFDEKSVDKSAFPNPAAYVEGLAFRKAAVALKKSTGEDGIGKRCLHVVIAADTVVVAADGSIVEKPEDEADARRMLRKLSKAKHLVYTGVSMRYWTGYTDTFHAITELHPREDVDDCFIDQYVASGDGHGKAGGYGIQSVGSLFVQRVEGCHYNVVGLPAPEVAWRLRRFWIAHKAALSAVPPQYVREYYQFCACASRNV